MKVTIETSGEVFRTLTIEIPWSIVSDEFERSFRELGKKVNLKGFRPGKVPKSVLRQRFGKQIEDEVAEKVIQDSFDAAMIQHRLRPVARPEITVGSFQTNQPYVFTARVEIRPEIELKEYKGLPIETKESVVDPKEVEDELKKLCESHAVLVPVEGRDVAQESDTAVIDYAASLEGKSVAGGERKDHMLELGAGQSVPGFEAAVVGMKLGETKEFDLDFPAEGVVKELSGKKVHFRLSLKTLKRRDVPELNDEFIKDLNQAEIHSVVELKTSTEKKVLERTRKRNQREAKEKLIDALVEKNPFPVPPSLVSRQQDALVREMEQVFQAGLLEKAGLTPEKMREDVKQRAEREVRAALLLAVIAEKEQIKVEDTDLEEYYRRMAEQTQQNIAKVKSVYGEEKKVEELRYVLVQDKVLETLLASAHPPVSSAPPTAAEPAATPVNP